MRMASSLTNRHVLIVEDEYFIADDMAQALDAAGATVIGPFGKLGEVIAALDAKSVDCAILDINLRGEESYPVAHALRRRGVPFVFASGYDPAAIEAGFADVPLFQKPLEIARVIGAVARMCGERKGASRPQASGSRSISAPTAESFSSSRS